MKRYSAFLLAIATVAFSGFATNPRVAYDIDMAIDICGDLPLESVEGIWLYPEDQVTVMILRTDAGLAGNTFPEYAISVVETSDTRLHPGDVIGQLTATPDSKTFKIELATEKKNDYYLKPKTCLATLSNDGDTFVFKKGKTGLKGRLSLNLNRLLPGFWKIISTGISTSSGNSRLEAPVGMVKIYPSYDGNGSSRRKTRYL